MSEALFCTHHSQLCVLAFGDTQLTADPIPAPLGR